MRSRCAEIRAYLLVYALVFAQSLPLLAEEENVIHIIGRRGERQQTRAAGHASVIEPSDSTRYEAVSHIKRTPSMDPARSGRINASGMALPRVRGHDLRLTEVYVDDFLLQDPYTSFPIVSELDLRAFGRLELMRGFTVHELPSTNPAGVVRFAWQDAAAENFSVGTKAGKPVGVTGWMLGRARDVEAQWQGRLYLRHHHTDGRYDYYSDEGTPYNVSDDRVLSRTNNDQRSQLAVPRLKVQVGRHLWQYFGILSRSERGVPAYSATLPSLAREHRQQNFSGFSWRANYPQMNVGVDVAALDDQQQINDPLGTTLGAFRQVQIRQSTQRASGRIGWHGDLWDTLLVVESTTARVHRTNDAVLLPRLAMRTQTAHLSLGIEPQPWARLDAKIYLKQISTEPAINNEQWQDYAGKAVTLLVGPRLTYGFIQVAQTQRPPSLWEAYGDGGRVEAAVDLQAEDIRHLEVGVHWQMFPHVLWTASVFRDDIANRIVMVPIHANRMRALNLSETSTRGIEGELSWVSSRHEVAVFGARLFPEDVSSSRRLQIPGVYTVTGGVSTRHGWRQFTGRWDALYRGGLYRDVANSIAIPGTWMHDVSLDWQAQRLPVKLGMVVNNIFDINRLRVKTADGRQSGFVTYSDVWGDPLPGRQWQFYGEMAL